MRFASSKQPGSVLIDLQWVFLHQIVPENNRQTSLHLQGGGAGISAAGDTTLSGVPSW